MKLSVAVAKNTQTAIAELGKKEKTLYYLVIGEGDDKLVMNVGEKTYDTVLILLAKQANEMDNKKKAS